MHNQYNLTPDVDSLVINFCTQAIDDMTNTPADVKQYFFKTNRIMTTGLVIILIVVSAIFWYTKAVTLESSSLWIGAALMLLAIIFYQLPFVSFLLTRRHFEEADRNGIEILDAGWKTFRKWLES